MPTIQFVSTMGGCPWGGSEELWSRAAHRLLEKGWTVHASVAGWPRVPKLLRTLQLAGCHLEFRPPENSGSEAIWQELLWPMRKRAVWATQKLDLVVISLDIHGHGLAWMQQCMRSGVKYAVVVQSVAPFFWPSDNTVSQFREAYEKAAAVFFVSRANFEFVRLQLSAPLRHARLIRNPFGVDYDIHLPWPPLDGGWKLACVARLEPLQKGQDILFDVLSQAKWRRRRLAVSLYGEGRSRKNLAALRSMLGLENVTFAGFASDVKSIWARHHALILPSRYEGMPLALVEAMLCGRPAIVTDVGGSAELVEDGVTGFVAQAPIRNSLDEVMERAWRQRENWPEIGLSAARRIRELVPRDPAGRFAEALEKITTQPRSISRAGGGPRAFQRPDLRAPSSRRTLVRSGL